MSSAAEVPARDAVLNALVLPQQEKQGAVDDYVNRTEDYRRKYQLPQRNYSDQYRKGMFSYQTPGNDPVGFLRNPFGVQHNLLNRGSNTSTMKAVGNAAGEWFNPLGWAASGAEDIYQGGARALKRLDNSRDLASRGEYGQASGEMASAAGTAIHGLASGTGGLLGAYWMRNTPAFSAKLMSRVGSGLANGLAGSTPDTGFFGRFSEGYHTRRDAQLSQRAKNLAKGKWWTPWTGGSRMGIAEDLRKLDALKGTEKAVPRKLKYLDALGDTVRDGIRGDSRYSQLADDTFKKLPMMGKYKALRNSGGGMLRSGYRALSRSRLGKVLAVGASAAALAGSNSQKRLDDRTQGILDEWKRIDTPDDPNNPLAELFANLPRMASGFMQNPQQNNHVRSWYQ